MSAGRDPHARPTSKQHPWRLQIFPDSGSVQLFVSTPQHKLCRQHHSDSTQHLLPLAASPNPSPKSWNEVHPSQQPLTGWTYACSDLDKNCTGMCRWSQPMGSFGAIDGTAFGEAKSLTSTGSQQTKSHMAKTEWLGSVTIIRGVKGTCATSIVKVPARTLTTSRISLSTWKSSEYFPWVVLSFRGTWPINILTKK